MRALRTVVADAKIGTGSNVAQHYAGSDRPEDIDAAERRADECNWWWYDSIVYGRYPEKAWQRQYDMGHRITVLPGDMEAMCEPLDFLGFNFYFSLWIEDDKEHPGMGLKASPLPEGIATTGWGWPIYPQGFQDALESVAQRYPGLPIIITENGATYDDVVTPDGQVHDEPRRHYLEQHFRAAGRAIQNGVPLQGYMVWTFMDNFEWGEGFHRRFGLVHNDFMTQQRTMKDSGRWYSTIIKQNAISE